MNPGAPTNPKDWIQELKSNRKTQGAVAGFVAVCGVLIWLNLDTGPKTKKTPITRGSVGPARLDDRHTQALQKLPDLAKLRSAGELPGEDLVARDPFLFEGIAAEERRIFIPPPPPPPPTPEEIEAKRLADDRQAQQSSAPKNLRYLGTLSSPSRGTFVGFMRGEEALSFALGSTPVPGWKLVKAEERFAEFQNLKYDDIKFKVEAREGGPGQGPGNRTQVVNEF